MYIWVENVTALLTQRTGFHQLQNFNRETQLMLLFAEVQVTTLLKLARINISSKFNSKFNIPFCRAIEIFSQDWHLHHRIFPYPVLSVATACVTMGHHHGMMTCLFSPISTSRVSHHQLSHYQGRRVNRKCPGCCDRTQWPVDHGDQGLT